MTRPTQSLWALLIALACLCLSALPSPAAEPPAEIPDWQSNFFVPLPAVPRAAPDLLRIPPDSPEAAAFPPLQRFTERYSNRWQTWWDRHSDRPHLIQGRGIPLIPGRGNTLARVPGKPAGLDQVEQRVRAFMAETIDLLGVDPATLRLDRRRSRPLDRDGELWSIELQQVHDGLTVEGARVFFRINHGNLVQFGSHLISEPEVTTVPAISGEEAFDRSMKLLGYPCGAACERGPYQLKILPASPETTPGLAGDRAPGSSRGDPESGYRHRLAWELSYRLLDEGHAEKLWIDAHSGDLLGRRSLSRFARVLGEVHDAEAPALRLAVPFPYTAVDNDGDQVTDAAGEYPYSGGLATTALDGSYIRIEDRCGDLLLLSDDGELDLGGGGTDCETPSAGGPGNTQAARDAFFHLTRAYAQAADSLSELPLDMPLTVRTNLREPCVARWNGALGTLDFSISGDDCANSGEIPGILYHEMGHAIDLALSHGWTDGATQEAAADTFALLLTRDPCVGRGLHPGVPCHGCDPECTGVRDLAAFATGGSGAIARPGTVEDDAGIDCDRFSCPYSDSPIFRGPLGYQAHCESYIASTVNRELAQLLIADRGVEAGWRTLEKLWYQSQPATGDAYRKVPAADFCSADDDAVDGCGSDNWFRVYLAVDDDDGDLSNGTPNGCRIWQAFDAHGIACGASPRCTCSDEEPIADAGPDASVCAGQSVAIGTPAVAGQTYNWLPGGQASAQITVTPTETATYTVIASTACGSASDEVTVSVEDCGPFDGDFDDGAEGWTAGGLWHLVSDPTCATPGASSPPGAMYYGRDGDCDFDTGERTAGDLVSPLITGISSDSVLRFDFWRQVESSSEARDRVELAIGRAGPRGGWEPRWSRDSGDPSAATWVTGPEISLAPYAGHDIQLRFRFDSVDAEANHPTGWLIDRVILAAGEDSGLNQPPAITVVEPPPPVLSECACVTCRFSAEDPEDGDLSGILHWTSDLDGDLSSGRRLNTLLSPGTHQLTATVRDYGGLPATTTLTVTIFDDPRDCNADDWPPAEPHLYCGDQDDGGGG